MAYVVYTGIGSPSKAEVRRSKLVLQSLLCLNEADQELAIKENREKYKHAMDILNAYIGSDKVAKRVYNQARYMCNN